MHVLLLFPPFPALCNVQKVKDKKFLKELGNRVRQIRLQQGLSQLDLGIAIDNYAEQIGRIERGELNVSICTLKLIAKGLQIPLHELLKF